MNEEQLQTLLRARAKIEAPADYSQKLLHSLQERQRAILLERSLWRIAAERLGTLVSEHSLSTPTYALALAAAFALGLAAISLLKPGPGGPSIAKQPAAAPSSLSAPVETQQVNFEPSEK
jgi:hypothetical protein